MRIIGGKHKRRRFDVPSSFNARPTTDFAKENLFNVLMQYIDFEDCRCLDLFAGTGGISAEMISRGAQSVLSVEQRREHAQFIQSASRPYTKKRLGIFSRATSSAYSRQADKDSMILSLLTLLTSSAK